VGAILARNPLPIILPCHRVIAADGTLGGFSGGRREEALRLKDSLLRYEGWNLERERDS
jgi:methylated-DNA-[protein]-cysteine S-methyltransferase